MQPALCLSEPGRIAPRVDWLTLFCPRGNDDVLVKAVGLGIVSGQASRGNVLRPQNRNGFTGKATRGAFFGERDDGWLITLSGDTAAAYWPRAGRLPGRASRLDLAVDYLPERTTTGLAEAAWREWCSTPPGFGEPRKCVYLCDEAEGETVALGSRSSAVYLRLYDWGVAHQAQPAGNVWRYEAELKENRADQALASLMESTQRDLAMSGLVYALFSDRRLSPAWSASAVQMKPTPREKTDVEQKLSWLRSQVAPTVAYLASMGELDAALAALGLSDVL